MKRSRNLRDFFCKQIKRHPILFLDVQLILSDTGDFIITKLACKQDAKDHRVKKRKNRDY